MPKQHVYLGKIRNPSPLKDIIDSGSPSEQARRVTTIFEGEWRAHLDMSYPRAEVWARMIDYLQKNNRPVYVEIDPETQNITRLHIPQAARVLEIQPGGDEVVYVYFHTSEARHYLRRNHPDFQQMLDSLQAAKDADSEILVTAANIDFEIIDVRPMPPDFGNDEPPGEPPPPIPDPPVTWDRAVELFDLMKAESCTPCSSTSPCIPYRYPYDGCWIRAHLMCYLMMDMGETPEKVWIGFGGLVAASSNVPECEVHWGWHVAPTLMVIQDSGPDVKMVIDPSLCTEPVTLDDWKALQGNPAAMLTPSSWDGYAYLASGTRSQADADNDMEAYRLALDELCSDFGPSPYSCPIVKDCFFIVDRSTISKDEIDAMLHIGSPAVIDAAFYVVVDGFAPSDLGITAGTLVGVPNIKPAFTSLPSVSQMTIDVMATIGLEDPVHLNRRQRITWKYKISFTGTAGFVAELEEIDLSASISTVSGPAATVSASAKIYLIKQPNPYEIDGQVSWLSTDLRVFQIDEGAPAFFNATMGTDAPAFITSVIQNLNSGNTAGQTFEGDISIDQQTSRLELSETVGGVRVFNFAVAKVRYRALSVSADDVRVFFRLFPASSTSLEYNQSTNYRRAVSGSDVTPLLGIIAGETVTIPCFAAPRVDSSSVSMTTQPDPPNLQTIPPDAAGTEVTRYFGCWLDINQTAPQFPINPGTSDGPFLAARKSVQELVRGQHQCLVAEIAFDPTPIPAGSSPSVSDKLAQRNLAIVESDNPGSEASHRIPHTFEIRPTRAKQGGDEQPDELMIDWGNTPVGSYATLYLPAVNTNDILRMAAKTYRSNTLVRIDSSTLQCETGGVTYIPIPPGEGANYAGMISVDLPDTVKKGQAFTIVVHQVTTARRGAVNISHDPDLNISDDSVRRILGSFQISIPVTVKELMLEREARLLSNLRWIQMAIPANNRWAPVFTKYLGQIADRVDALGGESDHVMPSPSGEWEKAYQRCRILGVIVAVLTAALLIAAGLLHGTNQAIAVIAIAVLLAGVAGFWKKHCRPTVCKWLKILIAGTVVAAIVLAVLLILGLFEPYLVAAFLISAALAVIAFIVAWVKGCFK